MSTSAGQRLVDIGVNLTHRSFHADLPEVLTRAIAAGVDRMIVTGTSVGGSRRAAELARAHPATLYSTAGVHPHHAKETDASTIPALRDLFADSLVVAVGECGLDYDRDFSPRDVQRTCFAAQLRLAADLKRPVFLHERSAHADFAAIVREHVSAVPAAVIHCFTGTAAELEAYLELGLHIGITGWICDDRRGTHLRDLVASIPEERLMIETDAPFLLPRDLRPRPKNRRNEPAFLPHVLMAVASAAGRDPTEVAASTTRVAETFFRL